MRFGGVAKGLPPIHHGEANALTPLGAERREELGRAGLGPIHDPEPDRSAQRQLADEETRDMVGTNGELVHPDDGRARLAGNRQRLAHSQLVHL